MWASATSLPSYLGKLPWILKLLKIVLYMYKSCLHTEAACGPEACGENLGPCFGCCGQLPRCPHRAFPGSGAPQLLLLHGSSVLGLLMAGVINALKRKEPPDENQLQLFRYEKGAEQSLYKSSFLLSANPNQTRGCVHEYKVALGNPLMPFL